MQTLKKSTRYLVLLTILSTSSHVSLARVNVRDLSHTNGQTSNMEAIGSIQSNLNHASYHNKSIRNIYLLKAAKDAIELNLSSQVKSILNKINAKYLTKKQLIEYKLTKAKLASLNRDNQKVISEIKTIQEMINKENNKEHKKNAIALLASAYQKENKHLSAAKQYVSLNYMLNDIDEIKDNYYHIWHNLTKVKLKELKQELSTANSYALAGWLDLAIINRQNLSAEILISKLKDFQKSYPKHPANYFVNKNLNGEVVKFKKVALLLPTSGDFKHAANALTHGFLTAYYQDKNPENQELEIEFYSSDDGNIGYLYSKAQKEGADIIIGPLIKENVEKLLKISPSRLSTPIITLNNIEQSSSEKVYQMGLSPEDEAKQLAKRAFNNNYKKPLVITESNNKGQRITNAFVQTWQELGMQEVADVISVHDEKETEEKIKNMLHVSDSEQRAKFIFSTIKEYIKHQPRVREDIDVIILATNAKLAKSIKPLLNFHFAADIQVYATSSVASNGVNSDLNNLIYCDMPYKLARRSDIIRKKEALKQNWPVEAEVLQHLHALGADAYYLAENINRLEYFTGANYQGVSGNLSQNEDRQIKRQLPFAKVIAGKSVMLKKQ